MAKRFLLLVLTLLLAAGLCGCEKSLAPMQLRAAPVSEETRQVLELTDNELTLWEYRTDGGSYDIAMNLWICRDGSWDKAQFFPGAAAAQSRFGVRITGSKAEYIDLAEDGTSRYSTDCPVDVARDSNAWSYASRSEETMIEPGVEIPLLARLGWDESTAPVPTDWQNFKDSNCNTGVAVTVTFTEVAER